eukprot:TRINITY_DN39612_c0_g1_i1.p1 TRINITY_DN39612_c0_g1~~TRINITY_DN39612_c0_g1_i1.p1  ORF type:complete len:526 (+),score=59.52 TRINITY_DN39612_c0_g1_i1:129-1706(+)
MRRGLLPAFYFLAVAVQRSQPCSFIVSNTYIPEDVLAAANQYAWRRGPDQTTEHRAEGWHFVHNLLSLTGPPTPQPFTSTTSRGVTAVFNGEVYNFREIAAMLSLESQNTDLLSDGVILLPAYDRWGDQFVRHLDGEFALVVVDIAQDLVLLANDPFGTKPLWYAMWREPGSEKVRFAAATYQSSLIHLGAPVQAHRLLEPNSALVVSNFRGLRRHSLVADLPIQEKRFAVHEWDLRQHKDHTLDWQEAFFRAVELRARDARHKMFVGMSSGYDSGAVMLAMVKLQYEFLAYSLRAKEHMGLVDSRISYCMERSVNSLIEAVKIQPTVEAFEEERAWLERHAEPFRSKIYKRGGADLTKDAAAVGLSYILARVRKKGARIYMSGSGADEIISDYSMEGHRMNSHSCFSGIFPANLSDIFPWCSFYKGTQRAYIMKEELTGGAHGIEVRYPFLDRRVVQEFLWLREDVVKNVEYKRPVADLLRWHGFPNLYGVKLGFSADLNLIDTTKAAHLPKGPTSNASTALPR